MDYIVEGAPEDELSRTPAATAVGVAAAKAGLLLAHFEYRVQLDPPEIWLPRDRPDLGQPGQWQQGRLAENKYVSFRNDMLVGSFHPGHRAKWTAHELCHGLVGFAWKEGASAFYHALAARLAEILPVALFYFYDEAHLRRCPKHAMGGPLFALWCEDCENEARRGPLQDHPRAEEYLQQGRAFVKREIDAVYASLKQGTPIATPWAALDLSSDGLAYAAAQYPRLSAPEYVPFQAHFFPENHGAHASLDALISRVEEVNEAILEGKTLTPFEGHRETRIAQDLGGRLLDVIANCDGEAAEALNHALYQLAADQTKVGIQQLIRNYREIHDTYVIPDPEDFFAVGYNLPEGYGWSHRQIAEGIASACPATWETLAGLGEDGRREILTRFVESDEIVRKPIGKRFAAWMADNEPGLAARIAEVEALISHAPRADAAGLTLGFTGATDERLAIDESVTVIRTDAAVSAILGLASGEETVDRTIWLAMRRDASGELVVLNLSDELGKALMNLKNGPLTPTQLNLEEEMIDILANANLIRPVSWRP